MKRAVIAAGVLALVLTGLIAFRIRAQRAALEGPATGSGVIEGEGSDLGARLSARVVSIAKQEGDAVEEGEVVLRLDCAEPEARLAEAAARLAQARSSVDAASASAEAARQGATAARQRLGAVRAQRESVAAQRDVAVREAERLASMGEHASTSARDQAATSAEGLTHQASAAEAEERATRTQVQLQVDQASAAAAQAEGAERSVDALEAMVRAARIGVDECEIRSPLGGVVERVYFEVGELVTPGRVVARVIDPRFMRATFYLPNASLGEAEVGAPAEVVADAYPGEAFSARVRRVALEAEFTPRNIQTRSDRDRLVYPVEVRIPNDDRRLRPGMPVEVTLGGEAGGGRDG
ncbi:MAG: HlyD family secretion protein [Sandaracinaceae bacterium]